MRQMQGNPPKLVTQNGIPRLIQVGGFRMSTKVVAAGRTWHSLAFIHTLRPTVGQSVLNPLGRHI